MGQQDRRRARARPEQALRGLLDHLAAVRPRGIDQHPRQPGPHEIDIGPAGGKPEHAGRDFARPAPGTPPAPPAIPAQPPPCCAWQRPSSQSPPFHHWGGPRRQPPRAEGPAVNRRQASPATPPAQARQARAGDRGPGPVPGGRHMPAGRQRFTFRTAPRGTIAAGGAVTAMRADRRPFTAAVRGAIRRRLMVLPGLRSAQGPCAGRAAARHRSRSGSACSPARASPPGAIGA